MERMAKQEIVHSSTVPIQRSSHPKTGQPQQSPHTHTQQATATHGAVADAGERCLGWPEKERRRREKKKNAVSSFTHGVVASRNAFVIIALVCEERFQTETLR